MEKLIDALMDKPIFAFIAMAISLFQAARYGVDVKRVLSKSAKELVPKLVA